MHAAAAGSSRRSGWFPVTVQLQTPFWSLCVPGAVMSLLQRLPSLSFLGHIPTTPASQCGGSPLGLANTPAVLRREKGCSLGCPCSRELQHPAGHCLLCQEGSGMLPDHKVSGAHQPGNAQPLAPNKASKGEVKRGESLHNLDLKTWASIPMHGRSI